MAFLKLKRHTFLGMLFLVFSKPEIVEDRLYGTCTACSALVIHSGSLTLPPTAGDDHGRLYVTATGQKEPT